MGGKIQVESVESKGSTFSLVAAIGDNPQFPSDELPEAFIRYPAPIVSGSETGRPVLDEQLA